jgi:hypothetical protein
MTRIDGANLLKRRLKKIGMVGEYSPHSFSATGITGYQKLIYYYDRVDKGCHFAAWERPELSLRKIRAAFKSLR